MNRGLPWYNPLKQKLAPTDDAVKIGLGVIILISLFLLFFGDEISRAIWFIYLISP